MIARRPELHTALSDVAHHAVDYFPGYSGHPQGWGWHSGGEVPAVEQQALDELRVVHLIGLVPARVELGYGAEAVLTPAGQAVLYLWDIQFSPAHAASGVPCVGEPSVSDGWTLDVTE